MTTNRCNLKCSHCYQDAGDAKTAELTTEEGKKLIDEIARAGFKSMIFSGGEPLMRPDIFELVAYAASKGLRPVFCTNGMMITKEVAQKLKDCGAMAMGISLDSLDEQRAGRRHELHHDSLSGRLYRREHIPRGRPVGCEDEAPAFCLRAESQRCLGRTEAERAR